MVTVSVPEIVGCGFPVPPPLTNTRMLSSSVHLPVRRLVILVRGCDPLLSRSVASHRENI